jgi:SH3 domain protein
VTRLILLILLAVATAQATAETRYVTDQLEITLRSGESLKHRIVRMLPSGTALEVLSSNSGTGYSRVRTEDGVTGYALTRHLLEEPAARERLVAVEAELAELKRAPDQLAAQLQEVRARYEALLREHEATTGEKERLEQELATIRHASANVVRITEERSELRRSVADLTRQVADLEQQNRDLGNQTTQRWFLIGAGVVAGGILLGLILPHLRFQRRKSSWGSL